MVNYYPENEEGMPICSEDRRCFDGKRCIPIGFRPGYLCQPAVCAVLAASRAYLAADADSHTEWLAETDLRKAVGACGQPCG